MILAEAAKSGGDMGMMFMLLVPFAVIIFWMMRSSRKKEEQQKKKREEMLGSVRKNDSVITVGGVHGEVVSVSEKQITLRVDGRKDVQLRLDKSAVREVLKKAEPAEKKEG